MSRVGSMPDFLRQTQRKKIDIHCGVVVDCRHRFVFQLPKRVSRVAIKVAALQPYSVSTAELEWSFVENTAGPAVPV